MVCAADIDIPRTAEAEASVFKVSGDGELGVRKRQREKKIY